MLRADFLEYVVTEEDYKTGLGIQAGLASGANTEFLFGRNEPGNQRFHEWVDRLLTDEPVTLRPSWSQPPPMSSVLVRA